MSSFDFADLLKIPVITNYLKEVDDEIANSLKTEEKSIDLSLERLIKSKSKRLRPILVIAVASSQGVPINREIISCCAAVELLHLASLVHDDIIDEAESRWSVPTINAKEGTNQAILTGDFIVSKALGLAATSSPEVASVLARAFSELCEGQSRELSDQFNKKRSQKSLLVAMQGKTAALMWASCKVGGLCSSISEDEVEAFANYGENFGMAFQLIDDVLDYISSKELLGKSVCNDIKEGNYTLPLLITLSGPDGARVMSQLDLGEKIRAGEIVDLMISNGSIYQTLNMAKKYNSLAIKALDAVLDKSKLTELIELPDKYMRWALNNLINSKYNAEISKALD